MGLQEDKRIGRGVLEAAGNPERRTTQNLLEEAKIVRSYLIHGYNFSLFAPDNFEKNK